MFSRMSDYLDPRNEELLKDFFEEAQSQVELLEANVLVLEGEPDNRDAVDEIFRAAHTLKGGAATVEMRELSEFTHLVEDVLDRIREGDIRVSGPLVDSLLASIDVVKRMLEERAAGRVFSEDIDPIVSALRSNLGESSKAAAPASTPKAQAAKGRARKSSPEKSAAGAAAMAGKQGGQAGALSEYELLELAQAAGNAGTIYRVTVTLDENNPMNTVGGVQVYAALKEAGKVLRSVPDFDALCGDEFFPVVDYYVASRESAEKLRSICSISDVTLSVGASIVKTSARGGEAAPAGGGKRRAPEKDEPEEEEQEAAAPAQAETRDAKSVKPVQGSVLRVDSHRIDSLLNLVSEAVIAKASFNQISLQYAQSLSELQGMNGRYRERMKELIDSLPAFVEEMKDGKSEAAVTKEISQRFGSISGIVDGFEKNLRSAIGRFRSSSQNLARIIGELQEAVMRIRMVPIAQVFSRFPRLIRDLSKSLGKSVSLVIRGEETELDKSVIEDLIDPLIHCVRNSLDHGLEPAEDREEAGKKPEGCITLSARNEGNMIVIEVSDDGRGIDVEAIKKKGVDRGLVHPSKNLTDTEAFNLIFEPGFSTARKVTNISGRGVGLDVVKKQVDKLNGSVQVSSVFGKGTTFTIRLPLTLAIIQGLLVRVGPEVYAIPITSVIESVRMKPSDIKLIDTYEVFNLRDDVLSLLRLNRLFRIPVEENRSNYFIVVIGTQEKKVGLLVDSLIGEEDLVIKPLKDHFTSSPGIAGATILGDGTVSLILDVGRLLEFSMEWEHDERRQRTAVGVK
jgi:two-component system chemotaxis sensor kinase CheA